MKENIKGETKMKIEALNEKEQKYYETLIDRVARDLFFHSEMDDMYAGYHNIFSSLITKGEVFMPKDPVLSASFTRHPYFQSIEAEGFIGCEKLTFDRESFKKSQKFISRIHQVKEEKEKSISILKEELKNQIEATEKEISLLNRFIG